MLEKPVIIKSEANIDIKSIQWSYEGRNGFWLFDQETNDALEKSFQKKEKSCQLLIAGNIYIIDFNQMIQYRKDAPFKKRNIKREKITGNSLKGIAGVSKSRLQLETRKGSLPKRKKNDSNHQDANVVNAKIKNTKD